MLLPPPPRAPPETRLKMSRSRLCATGGDWRVAGMYDDDENEEVVLVVAGDDGVTENMDCLSKRSELGEVSAPPVAAVGEENSVELRGLDDERNDAVDDEGEVVNVVEERSDGEVPIELRRDAVAGTGACGERVLAMSEARGEAGTPTVAALGDVAAAAMAEVRGTPIGVGTSAFDKARKRLISNSKSPTVFCIWMPSL